MLRRLAVATLVLLAVAACSSATTQTSESMSPDALAAMDVDLFGVVVDIPHRKSLGSTDGTATTPPLLYEWQTEHTLLERGSTNRWLSVDELQTAGLPVLEQGARLDFTGGMYRDTRFRLGGTIDAISISRSVEVRIRTQWRLYDTQTEDFIFEGASNGFARGQNLGTTGIQPNAMLDAFEDCLGDLIQQPEFQAAIAPPAPTG